MATGNGKIANLPREIREELNWRIDDDLPGIGIVGWLNAKPEVQAVMKEHYDGRPISEQNLSEWRKYGYQKWVSLHIVLDEALSLSDDAGELAETGINCEKLLLSLTASYAELIQRWNIIPAEQMIYKMGVFKNLTNAVLTLRRAEIQGVRLQFERERLELLREKQRNKSASSSFAGGSSRSGSGCAQKPHPNDHSDDSSNPASPAAPACRPAPPAPPPTQPECESSTQQPAPVIASSAPPVSDETSTQAAQSEAPVAPPSVPCLTEQLPCESAPPVPSPINPIAPHRNPRSRYSLL